MIPVPQGTSDRLRFEPIARAHADCLSDALLDPAVYEFIEGPHPASTLELAEQFERLSQGPAAGGVGIRWWNIAVLATETRKGLGQLQATISPDRAEIAYVFGSKHWGQGFAREAMNWFQEKLAEDGAARTLWATVAPSNERSVRLLMRLGYTPVREGWPELGSYDRGDLVFCRKCQGQEDPAGVII